MQSSSGRVFTPPQWPRALPRSFCGETAVLITLSDETAVLITLSDDHGKDAENGSILSGGTVEGNEKGDYRYNTELMLLCEYEYICKFCTISGKS